MAEVDPCPIGVAHLATVVHALQQCVGSSNALTLAQSQELLEQREQEPSHHQRTRPSSTRRRRIFPGSYRAEEQNEGATV